MKIKTISKKRRVLVMAGLAGAAAPAGVLAARPGDESVLEAIDSSPLVVSGRILGANRAPLAGATVELWQPDATAARASAITDGDGRFFTTIEQAARPRQLRYRVSHAGRALPARQLRLTRQELQRDDAGAWRATFGATLA